MEDKKYIKFLLIGCVVLSIVNIVLLLSIRSELLNKIQDVQFKVDDITTTDTSVIESAIQDVQNAVDNVEAMVKPVYDAVNR